MTRTFVVFLVQSLMTSARSVLRELNTQMQVTIRRSKAQGSGDAQMGRGGERNSARVLNAGSQQIFFLIVLNLCSYVM